jgi:hypothetical protein
MVYFDAQQRRMQCKNTELEGGQVMLSASPTSGLSSRFIWQKNKKRKAWEIIRKWIHLLCGIFDYSILKYLTV